MLKGFPGGPVVKNLPTNAGSIGDLGWILELGRSPGGGHSHPLQYSCLDNPVDRGAWGLQSRGSQRVGCNLSNWAHMHAQVKCLVWYLEHGSINVDCSAINSCFVGPLPWTPRVLWEPFTDTSEAMPHHSPVNWHHSERPRAVRGWRETGIHSSPGKRCWDLTRAVDVGNMRGTNSVEASLLLPVIQHFWKIRLEWAPCQWPQKKTKSISSETFAFVQDPLCSLQVRAKWKHGTLCAKSTKNFKMATAEH